MTEEQKMINILRSKTYDELVDLVRNMDDVFCDEIDALDISEEAKIRMYVASKERRSIELLLVKALAEWDLPCRKRK